MLHVLTELDEVSLVEKMPRYSVDVRPFLVLDQLIDLLLKIVGHGLFADFRQELICGPDAFGGDVVCDCLRLLQVLVLLIEVDLLLSGLLRRLLLQSVDGILQQQNGAVRDRVLDIRQLDLVICLALFAAPLVFLGGRQPALAAIQVHQRVKQELVLSAQLMRVDLVDPKIEVL